MSGDILEMPVGLPRGAAICLYRGPTVQRAAPIAHGCIFGAERRLVGSAPFPYYPLSAQRARARLGASVAKQSCRAPAQVMGVATSPLGAGGSLARTKAEVVVVHIM